MGCSRVNREKQDLGFWEPPVSGEQGLLWSGGGVGGLFGAEELDQEGEDCPGQNSADSLACAAGGFPEGLHRGEMCCVLGRPETTESLAMLSEDLGAGKQTPEVVIYRAGSSNDQLGTINYNSVEPGITFLLQPQAFHMDAGTPLPPGGVPGGHGPCQAHARPPQSFKGQQDSRAGGSG